MNMLSIFIFLGFLWFLQTSGSRIFQKDIRTFITCIHCKYFIPDTKKDYRFSEENKCAMFGKINLITSEFTPNNVIENRLNETKCGIKAKYFEKNIHASHRLFYSKIKYKVKSFLLKFRTTQ